MFKVHYVNGDFCDDDDVWCLKLFKKKLKVNKVL